MESINKDKYEGDHHHHHHEILFGPCDHSCMEEISSQARYQTIILLKKPTGITANEENFQFLIYAFLCYVD